MEMTVKTHPSSQLNYVSPYVMCVEKPRFWRSYDKLETKTNFQNAVTFVV